MFLSVPVKAYKLTATLSFKLLIYSVVLSFTIFHVFVRISYSAAIYKITFPVDGVRYTNFFFSFCDFVCFFLFHPVSIWAFDVDSYLMRNFRKISCLPSFTFLRVVEFTNC